MLPPIPDVLKNSPLELGLYPFLEIYFNETLMTNQQVLETQEHRWQLFFQQLRQAAQTQMTCDWLATLYQRTGNGCRTLLTLYHLDQQAALMEVTLCVKALDYLSTHPGHKFRTPVFAANLTGDPHSLDMDNFLGRMLYYGLLYYLDKPESEYTSEGKRQLFREAGLLDDDVSSNVIAAGLEVCSEDPRYVILERANIYGSPLILPLRFLEMPTKWQQGQIVYMIENPAVFSAILDACNLSSIPPIICGSGQPSVATLTLLDQLAQAGCIINYSGDFDIKGLEIAIRLAQRYKNHFQPWCFDSETYLGVQMGKTVDSTQLSSLRRLVVPWDKKLVDTIVERKLFIYQESFLEKLIGSIKSY